MSRVSAEVRDYAGAVAVALADVPEPLRTELLEDLQAHLTEVEVELEDLRAQARRGEVPVGGGLTLQGVLGPPVDYAAEMRRSAGVPASGRTPPDGRGVIGAVRARLHARLREVLDEVAEVAERPGIAPVVAFLPGLRPAWWVARAWLLVFLLAWISSGSWTRHIPIPAPPLLGLVALAVAVPLSVRLGQSPPPQRWRRLLSFGNAVCALVAVWLVGMSATVTRPVEIVEVPAPVDASVPYLTHPDGEPITNVYAYDCDGRPVDGLLLYDGVGRPITTLPLGGEPLLDIENEYAFSRTGEPVPHLYPLRQTVGSRTRSPSSSPASCPTSTSTRPGTGPRHGSPHRGSPRPDHVPDPMSRSRTCRPSTAPS